MSVAEISPLLLPGEAADILKVAEVTMRSWRVKGSGPAYVRVGNQIRYRRADIEAFIEAQLRNSTSQQPD